MPIQYTQDASLGVGLDTLVPDLAVQPFLIGSLDPGLADVGRPSIVHLVDTIELATVDASDIADEVDAERIQRIVPGQVRPDVDSGESVPVDRECRHLVVFQA